MIDFEKHTLNNGLKVIVNRDRTTPLAAVNIMYDVGARDEHPDKTGFAHLFEHFMFAGSKNIPKYDEPLEKLGGQNNAFTNNDITNYYCTLPVQNIETAFWLESDRMLELLFTEKNLEIQKNVIAEEFRQMYLNQPYGDAWLLLRPLAYKVHPYQWPTIGKNIDHVKNARMKEVRAFFKKYYNPNNAVLTVSADIEPEKVFKLADKWFGGIENQGKNERSIPDEPKQTESRSTEVERDVPMHAIFKAYHMQSRLDEGYYASDLMSDVLSNGNSSRLFRQLVKNRKLFSELNAFITGESGNGLFVIHGNLMEGVQMKEAEAAIKEEIEKMKQEKPQEREVEKVKNKVESSLILAETKALNKAINLAYYETIADASLVNKLTTNYRAVNAAKIQEEAVEILKEENCSTLYYYSKNR